MLDLHKAQLPEHKEWFRETREKRFGTSLEKASRLSMRHALFLNFQDTTLGTPQLIDIAYGPPPPMQQRLWFTASILGCPQWTDLLYNPVPKWLGTACQYACSLIFPR